MEHYIIDRLGHEGDGIVAQGPLFASYTLPGETVTATQNGQRLQDIAVTTPSPDRVPPLCRHFGTCGGCSLQHASDDFLARWKQDVVQRALAAHGLETTFRPGVTSAPHSRRRATFSGRRTRKTEQIGFFESASDRLVDLIECPVLRPAVLAARPILQALTRTGGSRNGVLRLNVTESLAGLDIAVTDGKPLDMALRRDLASLAEEHDLARLTWNGEHIALRKPPIQAFGAAMVAPPPGAFLQATPQGEAALVSAMQDAVGSARKVVDLFAGSGTFALPLAQNADVLAVEGDAAMMAALDRGWRNATGLHRVQTETRDLFRRPLLPAELDRFDAAVFDPPRAGAAAQVAEIALSKLKRLGAVSCNPVTFARDAKQLRDAGFTLDWVQVIDQFRWSPHVELAAQFSR